MIEQTDQLIEKAQRAVMMEAEELLNARGPMSVRVLLVDLAQCLTEWRDQRERWRVPPDTPPADVPSIIKMLPDDKEQALLILDAARRLIERFKR